MSILENYFAYIGGLANWVMGLSPIELAATSLTIIFFGIFLIFIDEVFADK